MLVRPKSLCVCTKILTKIRDNGFYSDCNPVYPRFAQSTSNTTRVHAPIVAKALYFLNETGPLLGFHARRKIKMEDYLLVAPGRPHLSLLASESAQARSQRHILQRLSLRPVGRFLGISLHDLSTQLTELSRHRSIPAVQFHQRMHDILAFALMSRIRPGRAGSPSRLSLLRRRIDLSLHFSLSPFSLSLPTPVIIKGGYLPPAPPTPLFIHALCLRWYSVQSYRQYMYIFCSAFKCFCFFPRVFTDHRTYGSDLRFRTAPYVTV